MIVSTKIYSLQSALTCAALFLLFTGSLPNAAMALAAEHSDETPNTASYNTTTPQKATGYKSSVAEHISKVIEREQAKALQGRLARDRDALNKVNNVHRMIDEAKKNGATDEDIRKGLTSVRKSPPVPVPGTTPTPVTKYPPEIIPGPTPVPYEPSGGVITPDAQILDEH